MSKLKKLASYLKKHPDDSFTKFALALECQKKDQYDKALVLFKSIVKNDPDYVGVYYHLGKLLENLGNNTEAQKTYNNGINVADRLNDFHSKSELQSALMNLELKEYE